MEIELDLDIGKIETRLSERIRRTQKELDAQVMKDSNYFIPKRDGDLERSVLQSRLGEGFLVWDSVYARRLYYGVLFNFSKDVNPNARSKWFENAKYTRLSEWERIANEEYNR